MDLVIGFAGGFIVGFAVVMQITNKARMKNKNEMLRLKRSLGVAMKPFEKPNVSLDQEGNVDISDWMVKK